MAYKPEIPQNFTREEIAELIFNVIPTGPGADPKEVINGMLSEAARYIACMTADSDTTEAAVVGLFKTYLKMHREELKKGNNQ